MRGGKLEPWRAALSVGVGLLIGVQPLYGLHLLLCLAICLPLRLDVLVAYAAANISNPALAPLIVMAELQIGSLIVDGRMLSIRVLPTKAHAIGHLAWQLGVGAAVLGVALAVSGGWTAAIIVRYAIKSRTGCSSRLGTCELEQAICRTRKRYQSAKAADRHYVANKLRFDPVVRAICEATTELGDVVDVGCGRGQLGLALLEYGKIRRLSGFDWDERKVTTARLAARGDAHYWVEDMRLAVIPEADTILIVDILHYLPHADQDALLTRAAAALRPGGTLVLRDVNASRTLGSLLAQCCERLSLRFGINRGRVLSFRSREQQCEALSHNCLTTIDTVTTPGLSLDNVLLIAVKPVTKQEFSHPVAPGLPLPT